MRIWPVALAVILSLGLLAACGGGEDEETEEDGAITTATAAAPASRNVSATRNPQPPDTWRRDARVRRAPGRLPGGADRPHGRHEDGRSDHRPRPQLHGDDRRRPRIRLVRSDRLSIMGEGRRTDRLERGAGLRGVGVPL